MKLELKHLSPYLPYKLKVLDTIIGKEKVMNLGQGASTNWVGIKTILNYSDNCEGNNFVYKPILRPLSDLTKEIEHNDEKFIPIDVLNKEVSVGVKVFSHGTYITMSTSMNGFNLFSTYKQMEKLFEWHFDVFGLIEKVLAIDINSIENETKLL